MISAHLYEKAEKYLKELSLDIHERYVGSEGNRKATELFDRYMTGFGFQTTSTRFDCLDWLDNGSMLKTFEKELKVFSGPYSMPCKLAAKLCSAGSIEQLKKLKCKKKILLLWGNLTQEPIMPKNFPFYNPLEHREIIAILEKKQPAAIIAATNCYSVNSTESAPFPLFEDGDFDIPSVSISQEDGMVLKNFENKTIELKIDTRRIPSTGYNIIARKSENYPNKAVIFAHIDSKKGSNGTLDNATGVVTLLILAELLTYFTGELQIEMVAMNGEDYYSNPGEVLYLSENITKFSDMILGINIDGVGLKGEKTAFSLYNCPQNMKTDIHNRMLAHENIILGPDWYQGDHGLFIQNNVPAMAVTSASLVKLQQITHTPRDQFHMADCNRLVELAQALHGLLKVL